MKNEAAFSTWVRTLAYKYTKSLLLFQRIETTTSSGVPDVLMITEHKTILIELKYETTKLRPMQYAWHKRMQKVSQANKTLDVCVLCAYPKTKRLVYYVADQYSKEYELNKKGIYKLFDDMNI
jgi:hypothetical protein